VNTEQHLNNHRPAEERRIVKDSEVQYALGHLQASVQELTSRLDRQYEAYNASLQLLAEQRDADKKAMTEVVATMQTTIDTINGTFAAFGLGWRIVKRIGLVAAGMAIFVKTGSADALRHALGL
jgi:hypothetical protein